MNKNSWGAIGFIFTSLGILSFVLGMIINLIIFNTVSSIPSISQIALDIAKTNFFLGFTPFLATSLVFFIIGAGGFYAGKKSKTLQNVIPQTIYQITNNTELPKPKQATCPSCGQQIIFIEPQQRWYCQNERKYI
jgi:ribosomal protein S27AE